MTRITTKGNIPGWAVELLDQCARTWEGDDYKPIRVRWVGPKVGRNWVGLGGRAWEAERRIVLNEYQKKDTGMRAEYRKDMAAVVIHEYAHLVTSDHHGEEFYSVAFALAEEFIEDGARELWLRDRDYRAMCSKVAVQWGVEGAGTYRMKRRAA